MQLASRSIVQAALQADGFVLVPTSGVARSRTRKHARIYTHVPRVLLLSPDRLSSVELTGEMNEPPGITVLGAVREGSPAVTVRNARLMALALGIGLPAWKQSGHWLTTAIKRARTHPRTDAMHSYRRVRFEYHRTTGLATLVIA